MAFSSARTALQALGLLVLSFTALAQTAPTPATPATSTTPAPSATPAVQAAPTPPVAQPTAAVTTASASSVLLSPQLVQGNYKDYLMKRYADNKEARAVVHMFGRKQVGGGLWLGGERLLWLFSPPKPALLPLVQAPAHLRYPRWAMSFSSGYRRYWVSISCRVLAKALSSKYSRITTKRTPSPASYRPACTRVTTDSPAILPPTKSYPVHCPGASRCYQGANRDYFALWKI